MKHTQRRMLKNVLVVFLAVVMLCLPLTVPTETFAESKTYIEVTKDNAPLRSGKAEKYSVVVRATKGTVFEVVSSSINISLHLWFKVKTSSGMAWIYSGNVKKVSVSGYTKEIALNKSSLSFNLKKGAKTAKLNAVCKYKNRNESNVIWSSSKSSVAVVDASGNVTAKGIGTCKIEAKHKIFGTTASCKVSVTESITLGVSAKEQSNSRCCSGASAYNVLKYLKGASFKKTDLDLFKEMGSSGVVYKVRNILNKYLGKTVYSYDNTNKTKSKYEKAIIKSISANYPVIALIKVNSKKYFKYTTDGHFTVISGYRINTDGSVEFRISDSYKTKSNGGIFWVPSKVLFSYGKAHGYPYYLILKK